MSQPPTYRLVTKSGLKRSLMTLFALMSVASLLIAGLTMPVIGAAGATVYYATSAYDEIPAELKVLTPSQQSVMFASDGSIIARFYAENRIVIPIDKMSPWIQKAIIAIEDRRFYQHGGLDAEGLARAVINNAVGNDVQGASTLTQQYVKNTLIERGIQDGDSVAVAKAREHSLARKLKEARFATEIEKILTKKQILQGYLNIAPFGRSVYGVEAASRHYFSKPAKDLTLEESALLAGIVQSPGVYDPTRNPEKAQSRRNQVLAAMLSEDMITQEQFDKAKTVNVKNSLKITDQAQGCATAGGSAYFCSWVLEQLYSMPELGKTLSERRALVLRGGLKIYTTLDPRKQAAAEAAILAQVPKNDPSDVKIALASVQPGTGKILAIAQNTNFGKATEKDPSATENSFAADRKHGGGFGQQPGSSFKPFTLAAWFDAGRSAYSYVGGKTDYKRSDWTAKCSHAKAADWKVTNNEGESSGKTNVIDATKRSINTGYAFMASKLDLCAIDDMARKMGAIPGGPVPKGKDDFYPPSIIGTNSVPPIYMANAYATWAANGMRCELNSITKIIKRDGKEVQLPKSKCERVVSPKVSQQVLKVLEETNKYYGRAAAIGRPAATKTGTTNSATNAWMVGTTPDLAAAVWVGHSDGLKPMLNITINKRKYDVVYGLSISAPAWTQYMLAATKGTPVLQFPDVDLGDKRGDEDLREPDPVPPGFIHSDPNDPFSPLIPDPNATVPPTIAPSGSPSLGQSNTTGTGTRH